MDSEHAGAFEMAVRHYFRTPDAIAMVGRFAAEPVGDHWRAQTVLTLPVFLALMLDGAPQAGEPLVEAVRGGDPVKIEVVAQALNYSHHAGRRRLMERLVGEHAAASMDAGGADFKDLQPTHPVHVEMLWAAFFATGDVDYIGRVAGLLAGWLPDVRLQQLLAVAATDETAAQAAMAGVLATSAQASLSALVREIPEVRDTLAIRAERQDGLVSALAARILAGMLN